MRLRVLGCSGGIGGRHLRTTSFLVDSDVLIDAGTGVGDLSLAELSLIDHIFILTRGGPDNASSLLLFYIYETGFKFWDSGYAAALTAVLLAILALLALLQFGLLERRTHYQ